MGSGEVLPVGRRVAYWRSRRKLSQQVFADRLGKSKSWVDKVERGVRSLDKLSTLQEIARVLRIDTAALVGQDAAPVQATGRGDGVERIRAALSATRSRWAGQRAARWWRWIGCCGMWDTRGRRFSTPGTRR